jgi:hypothetical protein
MKNAPQRVRKANYRTSNYWISSPSTFCRAFVVSGREDEERAATRP